MEKLAIGQRIAILRKIAKLTQDQLAEELHISNKTVSKWETGKGDPSIEFLEPLSLILGCTTNDLLNNDITEEYFEQPSPKTAYLSVAKIQRKYNIGYAKACYLLDDLEKDGYIKLIKTYQGYIKKQLKSKTEILNYIELKLAEE